MKEFKLWTVAIPIIALFSIFQLTSDLGEQGKLDSTFLREKIYPLARTINGMMTNVKFRLRGEEPHKEKIIILAADEYSLKVFGRWPWHRNVYALLIHDAFKSGAKLMGLDMVLSESEDRIPGPLFDKIKNLKLDDATREELQSLNTDELLAETIQHYREKLVLGFTFTGVCQPRYEGDSPEFCAIHDEDSSKEIVERLGPFALDQEIPLPLKTIENTSMNYLFGIITNLPLFSRAAKHSGAFYASPDPDGYIRRYPLFYVHKNKLYPSLALELARLSQKDDLKIKFTDDARIDQIYFGDDTKNNIPSTPLGYLDMNFHAHREDYNYKTISAAEFAGAVEKGDAKFNEIFKDSIVLFGATALGIYDMRAFPFDSNTPGVEGHATALDNILAHDSLKSASAINLSWLPLLLLWIFGIIFSTLFSKLEAIPSIAAFAAFLLLVGFIDIRFLFHHQINFSTAFLLLEVFSIFVMILSIRYILEEKNKKFIRQAFSFYLAPQVVDYVLKDPSKLSIGGERRDLSVIFTDLRGFTTLSENMDPKVLSNFLNEYLTAMTDIVFEFGGTLDKYIGDAVMAFWGAPIYREDHAYQAACAALKMQEKAIEMGKHFLAKYGLPMEMGVGLNTGTMSVGNMGSKKIFDYTVIGDHVNLASRLEGLNRLYGTGVLCSRFTIDSIHEDLRKKIYYRMLDSVKVKGKTTAIDIIELMSNPIDTRADELYHQAREKFKERKWDDAISLFKQSNEQFKKSQNREDPVCAVFEERCEKFKIDPPAENWDGSMEMRTK